MNLSDLVRSRYATKAFSAERTIPAEQLSQLCDLLRFAPSSTNSQPWHFVLAQSTAGKAQVVCAAHGRFASNASKINQASLCVVFCAKTDLQDDYLEQVLQQEEHDGRFAHNPAFKHSVDAGRKCMPICTESNSTTHNIGWKTGVSQYGVFLLGTAL